MGKGIWSRRGLLLHYFPGLCTIATDSFNSVFNFCVSFHVPSGELVRLSTITLCSSTIYTLPSMMAQPTTVLVLLPKSAFPVCLPTPP